MTDGIFESVSQRVGREKDLENRRIEEITEELKRRCCLYEKEYGTSSSNVNISLEQKVSEEFAVENNLWIPINQVFELGELGPSGNENDIYIDGDTIYKVNNLLNCRGSVIRLFNKISLHNIIFRETSYKFYGFTGFSGSTTMPIFIQNLVDSTTPPTQIEITTYMAALGFNTTEKVGCYVNSKYKVWDVVPKNVLKDKDGDIFVIDAEIELINEKLLNSAIQEGLESGIMENFDPEEHLKYLKSTKNL